MLRLVALFICLLSAPAFAGFEWIPAPEKSMLPPATTQAPQSAAPIIDRQPLQAAPVISAPPPVEILPLAPTNIQPQARNNTGKLVIDPYPLRNQNTASITPSAVYQAMVERSGGLHPVDLGNSMTTRATPSISTPIPPARRVASIAKKEFITPTGNGLMPMDQNLAPLPNDNMVAANNDAPPENRNYALAVGFGRDLPLALALSQIIPSDYTHSFAKDVEAGVTVSWEGGKPWNEVLNDMLRPQNMTAAIQGQQVIIQPAATL